MTLVELLVVTIACLIAGIAIVATLKERRKAKLLHAGLILPPEDPTKSPYHLDNLSRTHVAERASFEIEGRDVVDVVMRAIDPWFVPVAVALYVRAADDSALMRRAHVLCIDIGGVNQFCFGEPDATIDADQFMVSEQWDPFMRSGQACPVQLAAFSNDEGGRRLTLRVGNPHPKGMPISGVIEIWGLPLAKIERAPA